MIETLSFDAWERRDARYPAPTFFARPAWALALASTYAHLHPFPVSVEPSPGRRFFIPLMKVDGGTLRWRELVGMPLGAYTCVTADDGSIAGTADFSCVLQQLEDACDSIAVTPWPLADSTSPPGWSARRHATACIDLETACVRPERNRGITCEPCFAPDRSKRYYELLCEASVRWGRAEPPFPKRFLDALLSHGGADVEIWFARHGETPLAGGVVLYGASELFFWSAAMRREHVRRRPSNALNLALAASAVQRGLRWYNLGSSEGLPGVDRFKRSVGASHLAYAELRHERPLFSAYSWAREHARRALERA
jgi:hypothetical protein